MTLHHACWPILSLLMVGSMLAAEDPEGDPVPLGHRNFYPSDERPIGVRGDGTGHFPGATPVTEFWEAPHRWVANEPDEGERPRKWPKEIVELDDRHPSHNVVWKTRMPGWSLSQPLVVGDRVFACAEPHFLVCLDAHAGGVLWQKELLPLLAEGMPEDEARAVQEIIEIARAADYLQTQGQNPALVDANLARVGEWRARVEAIDPDPGILAAFDKVLGMLAKVAAGEEVKFGSFPRGNGIIANAVRRRYGVTTMQTWFGMVGYAMATPTSDGSHVYATFAQGQVACFDLAGGMRWSIRLPIDVASFGVGQGESPRLCGDVLLASGGDSRILYGLDKHTGGILWSLEEACGAYKGYALMHPRTPEGEIVDVVVPASGQIIRVADGKVLGRIDYPGKNTPELAVIGRADGFCANRSWNVHKGTQLAYRLVANSRDEVRAERLRVIGDGKRLEPKDATGATYAFGHSSEGVQAFAHGMLWYGGQIFDHDSGRAMPAVMQGGSRNPVTIAGDYAIAPFPAGSDNGYGAPFRSDRKTFCEFRLWDTTHPRRPLPVTAGNWLGLGELCNDIYLERYLDGFDRWLYVGCYHGWPQTFGAVFVGPTPAGNRVFVQSHSHVYCIGDPSRAYDGVAAQEPTKAIASVGADGIDRLVAQAQDGALGFRLVAIDALGRLQAEAAFEAVEDLLQDEHRLVRQRAAAVLPSLGRRVDSLVPQLMRALASGDQAEMETAAIVLRGMGARAAAQIPVLLELAFADGFAQRRWATHALTGMGEAAVAALAPGLDEEDRLLRAAEILGAIEGADHARARCYFALLRRQREVKIEGVHLGYVRVGHEAETFWPAIRNRFIRAAAGDDELVADYRRWVEEAMAIKDRKGRPLVDIDALLPLVLLDPDGHRDFIVDALAASLATDADRHSLDLAKLMGARAESLLPLLDQALAGTIPLARGTDGWLVRSTREHVAAMAAR